MRHHRGKKVSQLSACFKLLFFLVRILKTLKPSIDIAVAAADFFPNKKEGDNNCTERKRKGKVKLNARRKQQKSPKKELHC